MIQTISKDADGQFYVTTTSGKILLWSGQADCSHWYPVDDASSHNLNKPLKLQEFFRIRNLRGRTEKI